MMGKKTGIFSNRFTLLICISWAMYGCAFKGINPNTLNSFDGRWQANIVSPPAKRGGQDILQFSCPNMSNEVLHFIVKDSDGILITGGRQSAKGKIDSDGNFKLKGVYDSLSASSNQLSVKIEKTYILNGSLVELSGMHIRGFEGFNEDGCDYKVTISKVADEIQIKGS